MSELKQIFKDVEPLLFCDVDPPGLKENTIAFKLQEGPIKEAGENGCQVDAIIAGAAHVLRHFNKKFPCRENSCAITHLDEAIMWLEKRTRDREKRQVEGTNAA